MEEEAPLEEKVSQVSAEVPVCFSCGRRGHGVNRCSRVDTCFPFLPPEWSVDVWNGQYRATRTVRAGLWSPPGNEGWSGREGQPPGSSGIKGGRLPGKMYSEASGKSDVTGEVVGS